MTKEGILKHKEVFDAWLDGAEVQFYHKSKEKWIDIDGTPSFVFDESFRIKPTKIEFEDCSFNRTEYKVNKIGNIIEIIISRIKTNNNRIKSTLFKDKEIAEAYAVLPQLIRLKDEYNGGWKPDWENKDIAKYYIGRIGNDWDIGFSYKYPELLSFKSFEIRDKFFEDYKDLIEIAKPLL